MLLSLLQHKSHAHTKLTTHQQVRHCRVGAILEAAASPSQFSAVYLIPQQTRFAESLCKLLSHLAAYDTQHASAIGDHLLKLGLAGAQLQHTIGDYSGDQERSRNQQH